MFGYMSNFHLKYRVILNNLSGHTGPQERAPSFLVSFDGALPVEKHVENGMKGIVPPVRPPVSPAARKTDHSESMRDALKAVTNLQNSLDETLSKKPVVPRPADVPKQISLEESIPLVMLNHCRM